MKSSLLCILAGHVLTIDRNIIGVCLLLRALVLVAKLKALLVLIFKIVMRLVDQEVALKSCGTMNE